ncbi:MAG: FGGY-family carbohydrate kinase [Dehalococcoidales bacterium]
MLSKYILAIDAGTSGVCCLIADFTGHVVSLCHKEWSYQSLNGASPLAKEFNPNKFWRIICDNIKETLNNGGINTRDIVGISATSQREGAVFLDKNGGELYAGPNIDLRALTEGISIDNEFGSEIYHLTGHTPSFLFVPAKLKWFKANQPETYSRIATVLSISDWIIFRLSGERVSEVCGANELGLVDIRSRQWSSRLKELLDLPESIYPEFVTAGSQVGKVTRQAGTETGIMEGTPVVQAAPDTHCGLIGMGVKEKGQVGIVLGWSAPVQMVTDKPVLDPEAKIWTSCYPLPRRWILESNAGEAGNAYHWLKQMMFGQEDSSREEVYNLMDRLASEVPLGAEEVRAFIGPATMNMSHLTMKFGGFLFPVPLSATNIQRTHLVRASLENLCFAIKANCLQLEAISGLKVEEVKIGGSLAKSQCLAQILPNVLEVPVFIPEVTEVSALGAAVCAAVGSGAYSNLEEGMKAMTPRFRVVEPDRLSALEYAEYYQKWTTTAKWLERLSEEIK